MIDRFNFYDIYGYLLPGVLLFASLWIPLGALLEVWPPVEWTSAIVILALAYIAGHILHSLSETALSFEFKAGQTKRAPSDLLFDSDKNQVLIKSLGDLKQPLATQIFKDFGVDVHADQPWEANFFLPRLQAFLRCRNILVRQKAAAYAEQQQGMYVLMRGAAASFFLSFAFYGGIALGLLAPGSCLSLHRCGSVFFTALFLSMIAAAIFSNLFQSKRYGGTRERESAARRILFWLVVTTLFLSGFFFSEPLASSLRNTPALPAIQLQTETDPVKYKAAEQILHHLQLTRYIHSHGAEILLGWTAVSALLALICFAAYRSFAVNFALTIYRDYANAHFAMGNSAESSS